MIGEVEWRRATPGMQHGASVLLGMIGSDGASDSDGHSDSDRDSDRDSDSDSGGGARMRGKEEESIRSWAKLALVDLMSWLVDLLPMQLAVRQARRLEWGLSGVGDIGGVDPLPMQPVDVCVGGAKSCESGRKACVGLDKIPDAAATIQCTDGLNLFPAWRHIGMYQY